MSVAMVTSATATDPGLICDQKPSQCQPFHLAPRIGPIWDEITSRPTPATNPEVTGAGMNLMKPASRSDPAVRRIKPIKATASDIAAQIST